MTVIEPVQMFAMDYSLGSFKIDFVINEFKAFIFHFQKHENHEGKKDEDKAEILIIAKHVEWKSMVFCNQITYYFRTEINAREAIRINYFVLQQECKYQT